MKKSIIILLSTILLSSCSVTQYYDLSSFSVDLNDFEVQGIFVTNGDLADKEYKSLGFVVATCYPGYDANNQVKLSKPTREDDLYSQPGTSVNPNLRQCAYQDLFNELIIQAKKLNANGIINLKIIQVSKQSVDGKTLIWGTQVEGFAVRLIK